MMQGVRVQPASSVRVSFRRPQTIFTKHSRVKSLKSHGQYLDTRLLFRLAHFNQNITLAQRLGILACSATCFPTTEDETVRGRSARRVPFSCRGAASRQAGSPAGAVRAAQGDQGDAGSVATRRLSN